MQREALPPRRIGSYFAAPKDDVEFVHSGCKVLDLALGGGWAENRIINIVGDKSTGKTLLCIEAAANFARKYNKGRIYYRESEAAFQKSYAEALGMPLDRVEFGEPLETVEDLFEELNYYCRQKQRQRLYILDSLDALSDREELQRDFDKGSYGTGKAKAMSKMFRELVRKINQSNLTLIIVSQVRDKIGAMFGRKTTRTGGRALDFYASQVVYLAQVGTTIVESRGLTRATGVQIKAKLDKNKVALPFREAEFEIQFGFGIDDAGACVNWLRDTGYLGDIKVPKTKVKEYLKKVSRMPPDEYEKVVCLLHETVQHRWYQIEEGLLPTRRKYT